MLKRLRWMTLGALMGLGARTWLQRRLKQSAARYVPAELGRSLVGGLRAALEEGREAMREREAELRAIADAPPASPPRRASGDRRRPAG